MANIWRVYDGRDPTVGPSWMRLPIQDAIKIFELGENDRVGGLGETPRFGDASQDLQYQGFKHVVIEIDADEAQQAGWPAGYYRSRVSPADAYGRLIRHAVIAALGERNVVRVEHEPTIDSYGKEALRVTVVLAPNATKRLRGEAVLDALVSLQARLRALGDDRVGIIQYATEAELAEDVGSQS